MYFPSEKDFCQLAAKGNLVPVYREILADMETPVSAFRKIDDGETSFLLESIEGGEVGSLLLSRQWPGPGIPQSGRLLRSCVRWRGAGQWQLRRSANQAA